MKNITKYLTSFLLIFTLISSLAHCIDKKENNVLQSEPNKSHQKECFQKIQKQNNIVSPSSVINKKRKRIHRGPYPRTRLYITNLLTGTGCFILGISTMGLGFYGFYLSYLKLFHEKKLLSAICAICYLFGSKYALEIGLASTILGLFCLSARY